MGLPAGEPLSISLQTRTSLIIATNVQEIASRDIVVGPESRSDVVVAIVS
jgi:hypothetical protein